MKIAASTTDAKHQSHGLMVRVVRILLALVLISFLLVAGFLVARPEVVQSAVHSLESRWGYAFKQADAGLAEKWSIAIGSYLRETIDGVPDVPQLVLDIPFKEMRKIYAKRDEALARGILVQGDDDFVNGSIRVDGEMLPVKLRLKGDWNDHLMGRKWSFRVHVRKGKQLNGMRRFSIQNPNTRGFQSELMFFAALNNYNVMTPRYSFAEVTLNGDSMGIMAVEEFFAKELLEFSRRREGVIVRFNESLVWSSQDATSGESVGWGGAFDHYQNAPIDSIGSSRIAESAVLTRQYTVAEGLLRGFAEKRLQASDVFDVQQMGAFLAVADLFGSWHAVAWHNLRFYLNPITLKLEPLVFDATLQDRFTGTESVINDEPIVADMLRDPLLWAKYAEVVRELATLYKNGELQGELQEVEAEPLRLLKTEFRMLSHFPLDYLGVRAEALLERIQSAEITRSNQNLFVFVESEIQEYPLFAHLGVVSVDGVDKLQIDNAIPKDVRITAIDWVNSSNGERVSAVATGFLPLPVPARGVGSNAVRVTSDLLQPPNDPLSSGWVLEVSAGLTGRNWLRQFRPARIYPALDSSPLTPQSLAEVLRRFPFLQHDVPNSKVTVPKGVWAVPSTLSLPIGLGLSIGPGTTLAFASDASLIVNGPVLFSGTANEPVILRPDSVDSWPGMVVLNAGSLSKLTHVRVEDTHSVTTEFWTLTGGVNFYASDVEIDNTQFIDSHGEDALNIIHSKFVLRDILVNGTASDAFDADFAEGEVIGGQFENVGKAGGGDAIDISGSMVIVDGTKFDGIADKALSVGERSQMTAKNVTVTGAGTGAASKDGSHLTLQDSVIDGASFAGMTAYIKKSEHGPARIDATNVRIANTKTQVLAQTLSEINVDGTRIETADVDVDALYETVMKPGLRK